MKGTENYFGYKDGGQRENFTERNELSAANNCGKFWIPDTTSLNARRSHSKLRDAPQRFACSVLAYFGNGVLFCRIIF